MHHTQNVNITDNIFLLLSNELDNTSGQILYIHFFFIKFWPLEGQLKMGMLFLFSSRYGCYDNDCRGLWWPIRGHQCSAHILDREKCNWRRNRFTDLWNWVGHWRHQNSSLLFGQGENARLFYTSRCNGWRRVER